MDDGYSVFKELARHTCHKHSPGDDDLNSLQPLLDVRNMPVSITTDKGNRECFPGCKKILY